MSIKAAHEQGFALLMTLLVVSVVVSVALSIVDVTIKQTRLAASANDSETAFNAANAGLECAQYHRRRSTSTMEVGQDNLTFSCFGSAARKLTSSDTDIDPVALTINSGTGRAYVYSYQVSTTTARTTLCSQIDTVIMYATTTITVTAQELRTYIPGYPNSAGKTCLTGGVCTILAVRGYNRTCPSDGVSFGPGTIQREALLEY